jgi:hypothetical protein
MRPLVLASSWFFLSSEKSLMALMLSTDKLVFRAARATPYDSISKERKDLFIPNKNSTNLLDALTVGPHAVGPE